MTARHPATWLRCPASRAGVAVLLFLAINIVFLKAFSPGARMLDEREVQRGSCEARQQGQWTWWVTRGYLMRRYAPDIVLLGSSQMACAVFASDTGTLKRDLDCVEYRRAATLENILSRELGRSYEAYNFAMGGEMASDGLMIARALLTGNHKPRLVVMGISPRDFMDNTLPSVSATEPFRFFAPYVQLGPLAALAFPNFFEHLDWTLNQWLPLKHLKESIAQDVLGAAQQRQGNAYSTNKSDKTKSHKDLLRAALASADEVRPGEWVVPYGIGPSLFEDNTKEYRRRYHSPDSPVYKGEMAFFKALLSDLRQKHIAVLVVGMPSLWPNRVLLPESFWTRFRSNVVSACTENGAQWVDLSDNPNFVITDYLDTVHLNASGGQKLFGAIAGNITGTPRLAQSLAEPPRTANTSFLLYGGPAAGTSAGFWH